MNSAIFITAFSDILKKIKLYQAFDTILLIFAIFISACSKTELSEATSPDNAVPAIVSVTPANNATQVSTSASLSIEFNEKVDSSTVNNTSVTLIKGSAITIVPGILSVEGSKVTFTPSSDLTPNTLYTVTVTKQVKDVAGNPMAANYSWSFTTGGNIADVTRPVVSSVIPAVNSTGIASTIKPSAVFSELIDPATINTSTFFVMQGSSKIAGAVTLTGTTATFTPGNELMANTVYTVTLTTGVKDMAGNSLASAYSWTFTTAQASLPVAKSFAGDVVPVLNQCNNCHRHSWTPSPTPSIFHANLVSSGHINLTAPLNGKIYIKLNGGHPSSGVSAQQKTTVLDWIKEGSKNN